MRIGLNPQKDKTQKPRKEFHQVVIPVYIPEGEGYFKDSFEILKICLDSLFKTTHNDTYFTIINNGSRPEVSSFLDQLLTDGSIHELIHTHNVGKLNAVFKGVAGHNFPLVTVTDADVLFLNGWQAATYAIFDTFDKAGFVSPTPIPKLLKYNTFNILTKFRHSKALQFTSVPDPEAMQNFAESIENPDFYNQHHLEKMLTLEMNGTRAAVGAGHFVATFRGDIFKNMTHSFSEFNLGGKAVRKYLDQPVIDQGYWRLSTEYNFAYHMGNTHESWMTEKLQSLKAETLTFEAPTLDTIGTTGFRHSCSKFWFEKFLSRGRIWKRFLRRKGLSSEAAQNY